MSIPRILQSILALAFLAGCGGGADKPKGDSSYVPHADGSTWSYRFSRDNGASGAALAKIDGAQQVGSVLAQRLTLSSDLASGSALGEVRRDGLILYSAALANSTLNLDPPLRLLDFPFELGDSFHGATRFSATVIPVDAHVDTRVAGFGPADAGGKTFEDVFRLETTVSLAAVGVTFQSRVVTWLAPQVGVVRAEVDLPQSPLFPLAGHISAELEAFSP
jgi:hypothetical protein